MGSDLSIKRLLLRWKMPKVKGRKQRKLRKDRINFLMRLCPRQHQQLKRLAEQRQETIALIIERYLEYMLLGEIARLDREQEQERMAVAVVPNFEVELYQEEAYSKVESLVGSVWLKMNEKRRRALAFLAMFPYEAGHRLARMMGMARQGLQKIKESEVGLKVINHFSDRSLWSKRPEFYGRWLRRLLNLRTLPGQSWLSGFSVSIALRWHG